MNEDVRTLKDDLENLIRRKSTSRRILTGILSKNKKLVNLGQNLRSKRFSAWSSLFDKQVIKKKLV